MGEGHTARRGSGREIPALLALLVWGGGFELAPFLHAIDHGHVGAHIHGEAHSHGAASHEHDGEDAPDPEHGDGSLAHRGLAAHTAPPALPPIDAPRVGTAEHAPLLEAAACSRWSERPRARAPPVR